MRNKLSLLGFIGFLGLLGLFTNNPGFYGFFGFFSFFVFLKVLPDEMFEKNVNKAAKNAFFTGVLSFPIVALCPYEFFHSFFHPEPAAYKVAFVLGFGLNFALQAFVFGISLAFYETKGDK